MSEDDKSETAAYAKGDRVAIVRGKKDVGARGEIFWIGANKYGPGMRYGIRGDDGETYWSDEASVGPVEGAPPPPEKPASDTPVLAKGSHVEITGGREGKGEKGEIFWVGDSRYGGGKRYGIRAADEQTYWVDDKFVTAIEGPPPSAKGDGGGSARPADEDARLPDASDFADFDDAPLPTGGDFEDAPMPDAADFDERDDARAGEDDIPFDPDEDLPF